MATTIISAPKHWSTADIKDMERQIIELIDPRDDAIINVKAVRALTYDAKWTSLKASRAARKNQGLEVKYETLR